MEKLELTETYETIEEIPAYGFSGREDLIEVSIPRTVKKIGRYAFYNCRNLEKITFYSDIQDVGSGAFTGCHKVHHLDVTFVQGKTSCLKDFLQELTEEMLVEYRGEEYARLMFPEYYEEGVENTPARILMTQIHGSGLKYRNCFYKKEFQFEEYDKRFPYAQALESPQFVMEMVLGRLMYPCQLLDKGKNQYEKYLQVHSTAIGKYLIQKKDVERLSWLLEQSCTEAPLVEELLEESGNLGVPECTSCLMEWRRKNHMSNAFSKSGIPAFEF